VIQGSIDVGRIAVVLHHIRALVDCQLGIGAAVVAIEGCLGPFGLVDSIALIHSSSAVGALGCQAAVVNIDAVRNCTVGRVHDVDAACATQRTATHVDGIGIASRDG